MPILVRVREFGLGKVTCDTGHSNIALAPWLAEIKIECVVLDELAPRIALQLVRIYFRRERWTAAYRLKPSAGQVRS